MGSEMKIGEVIHDEDLEVNEVNKQLSETQEKIEIIEAEIKHKGGTVKVLENKLPHPLKVPKDEQNDYKITYELLKKSKERLRVLEQQLYLVKLGNEFSAIQVIEGEEEIHELKKEYRSQKEKFIESGSLEDFYDISDLSKLMEDVEAEINFLESSMEEGSHERHLLLLERLAQIRDKYNEVGGANNSTLDGQEKETMRQIDAIDFLREYKREERLRFITTEGISGRDLGVNELTFTFSYDGVFNRELYMAISAGQVLPKSVGTVESGGKEYTRHGLLGEFLTEEGERLKISEGTYISNIGYRGQEDIIQLEEGNTQEGMIKKMAFDRGLNPELLDKLLGAAIEGIKDQEQQKALIEDEMKKFENFKKMYGEGGKDITVDSIQSNQQHKNVFSAFFNNLYAEGGGWSKSDTKGIVSYMENTLGISKEVIGETQLGKRIVNHLKNRNYKAYVSKEYNCGANVGDCLAALGIVGQGIPGGGRDGKRWRGFLRQRPDFVEAPAGTRAQDAPPGSVISYQPTNQGSKERQSAGHVEIALGGGKYWLGKTSGTPGGSHKNPPTSTYTVFTPKG